MGAAVDGDDGSVAAEHPGDFFMEIIERVAMLTENDDFAQTAPGVLHVWVALEDAGKLVPLPILTGGHDRASLILKANQNVNFSFQFGDGFGRGSLVNGRFFEFLLLAGGQVIIIIRRLRELWVAGCAGKI